MQPEKNQDHALVELVDVLLREGAVLQADVVVTVADVPLIGINLQAAIAGMATMTEYGLLREFDTAVRKRPKTQRDRNKTTGNMESKKHQLRPRED
ncbi:gas vesicle protein GvpM [Halodesulfurarchaeum sp.]|uniref:gas vesicle protein GvpM n=1 Tax=Halodesulfurarchaeum sp. TaxID=1980530 RepID=UPI002FC2BA1D